MCFLLLVISDSALLPLSATGGGRKATICFGSTTKTSKTIFFANGKYKFYITNALYCPTDFTIGLIGEHSSPLQYNNRIVGFTKFVFTYIFCHYLRASNERPYKLTTTFIYKLKSHQSFFGHLMRFFILYYLLELGTATRRNFQLSISYSFPYHHIYPRTKLFYRLVYMK